MRKIVTLVSAILGVGLSLSTPASAAEKADKEDHGVSVGVLGGVGFPRPLAIEGIVRSGGVGVSPVRVMFGAEYGFLPQTRIASVETSLWAASANVRFFPFKKGLFIGLRGGLQHVAASATVAAGSAGTYTESVAIDSWFINPRIGVLWIWKPLALGIEGGVQFPITSSVSTKSDIPTGLGITTPVASAADTFGRTILPTVDLLRVGLVF